MENEHKFWYIWWSNKRQKKFITYRQPEEPAKAIIPTNIWTKVFNSQLIKESLTKDGIEHHCWSIIEKALATNVHFQPWRCSQRCKGSNERSLCTSRWTKTNYWEPTYHLEGLPLLLDPSLKEWHQTSWTDSNPSHMGKHTVDNWIQKSAIIEKSECWMIRFSCRVIGHHVPKTWAHLANKSC